MESKKFQPNIQPLSFISPNSLFSNIKYVTEGHNVTFECAATGVPFPQLIWSFTPSTGKIETKIIKMNNFLIQLFIGNKHNIRLGDGETFVNILSLVNVNINNSGTYTCHALQSMTGLPDFPHAQVMRCIIHYIICCVLYYKIIFLFIFYFIGFSIRSDNTTHYCHSSRNTNNAYS